MIIEYQKVPSDILTFLKAHSRYYLVNHLEPDGDCVGSQLGLASFLKRQGKEVRLFSPGPFLKPEIVEKEGLFDDRLTEEDKRKKAGVIVLDCSSLDRIGPIAEDITGFPVAVIDHHTSGHPFGDVRFIDTKAPSVTFMVQRIIEAFGETPTREEAAELFFGLCTDTGYFRHLDSGSGEVFLYTGRLINRGISPKDVYHQIYGGASFASRMILGKMLTRTEQHFGGKVFITWQTLEDMEILGKIQKVSDNLYQLLQGVKGCEVVVFIKEEKEEECSIGLRSNHSVDVGKIARSFGGGGHKRASGFYWKGSKEEVKGKLIETFSKIIEAVR
ncbi:MAG: bifunctional oligoribonuclease/PAP phosphatase NrnA [Spirochaetales bacterium]|nr:bifunctional oligoribonuclease/PAP phosphatase NrnA [Spirochaetales bacterium]